MTLTRNDRSQAFCTAGATIVSGAVAERVKSPTYAVFAFLLLGFDTHFFNLFPVDHAGSWKAHTHM